MKIIYKYILKKFYLTFFFTIALFIVIAVIFDISENIDDFIESSAPLKAVVFDYYLNFIPYFMNLFSPLFIFIAVIYFTSRMAYNTEIVAILSAGINFYRLLIPYLTGAITLALLSFYLNGWVIPKGNRNLIQFEKKYMENVLISTEQNIHRQLARNIFMYLESYDFVDSVGQDFTLEKFEDKKLKTKVFAKSFQWDEPSGKWRILNYKIRQIDGLAENYLTGDEIMLKLPLTPKDFGRKEMVIQAMTNDELEEFIYWEKLRGAEELVFYEIELYKRSSLPFATIVLVVLALAISSRKLRGGMGMHLGIGILLAFSYILLLQFSTTFATNANFPPMMAVWFPNILYGILSIYLLLRAPK